MKAVNKHYPLRAIALCFLILLINSCKKPENELPAAPTEIILAATVPKLIYSNIKEIFMDASGTKNLNGRRELNFSWTCTVFPSGSTPPRIETPGNASTKVDRLLVGEYRFQLTVIDLIGNKAEENFSLEVRKDTLLGVIPKVYAGPDQVITAPDKVFLNGNETVKLNPILRALEYRWSVIKQPAGSPPVLLFSDTSPLTASSPLREGTYQFQLEVINDYGIRAYDTLEVKVNPDPFKGLTRIFDTQVWTLTEFSEWKNYVIIKFSDGGLFVNRDETNMEVSVWDDDKKDWADAGIYTWYVYEDELLIFYPWSDNGDTYIKDVGNKAKVRVKIL